MDLEKRTRKSPLRNKEVWTREKMGKWQKKKEKRRWEKSPSEI
jgi:hypothetical protein